jgi:hypothetical protein
MEAATLLGAPLETLLIESKRSHGGAPMAAAHRLKQLEKCKDRRRVWKTSFNLKEPF